MKIEFRKIAPEPKNFTLNLKDSDFDIKIEGKICRLENGLVRLDSKMSGEMQLICDKSGEEFMKQLNLNLTLFVKNGLWQETHKNVSRRESHIMQGLGESSDENLAVIEVFDNFIDLDSLFLGEIESIKLDYHTKN